MFLMANLGAEASRIIAAQERRDADAAKAALARAENILSEIAALPDMQPRAQELDALGGALRSLAANDSNSRVISPAHLQSYFAPFALRLMADK